MEEYLLFADETKPTKDNPFFCFSGISISREYYEQNLIPEINALKKKYFGTTDIVFHFTDMKKNKNEFSIFIDETKRNKFWDEFVAIIKKSPIDILGVYFDDAEMTKIYPKKPHSNYDLGFYALLDNYVHYLKSKDAYGQICIESRTFKENSYLQKTFYEYIEKGSLYFSEKDTKNYLTSLGFIIKKDNCIGLQVADVVPSQILRYVKGSKKDFHGLAKVLGRKIYGHGTSQEHVLGLKNLL